MRTGHTCEWTGEQESRWSNQSWTTSTGQQPLKSMHDRVIGHSKNHAQKHLEDSGHTYWAEFYPHFKRSKIRTLGQQKVFSTERRKQKVSLTDRKKEKVSSTDRKKQRVFSAERRTQKIFFRRTQKIFSTERRGTEGVLNRPQETQRTLTRTHAAERTKQDELSL
ncbi:hypothetical protein BaRGS_00036851 [Batillaria attramentaria]|uniref:Uncharacterized protein n=1 Tax=Batillaria attramentaria TaxID=370345 RepID=A0ABD0JAQ2_9CAEN